MPICILEIKKRQHIIPPKFALAKCGFIEKS